MDNLNIHHRKSLTDLFGKEIGGEIWDRFTIHYTPIHGSPIKGNVKRHFSPPACGGGCFRAFSPQPQATLTL